MKNNTHNTAEELRKVIHSATITRKKLPEGYSLNDLLKNGNINDVVSFLHPEAEEEQTIVELKPVLYQRPHEDGSETQALVPEENSTEEKQPVVQYDDFPEGKLEIIHEHKLLFKGRMNHYYVLGTIPQDLSSLPVTLLAEDVGTGKKERVKIDLYERELVQNFSMHLAEFFSENPEKVEADLFQLTELLENLREKLIEINRQQHTAKSSKLPMTNEQHRECIEFLKQPNLIHEIDRLIEKSGVVGEENTRKLLFVVASTYKMTTPLHSLVQGTSGSGKSHLINSIGQCFPAEDVLSMTRVTSKSFYHYTKDELVDKLILIQDYDGLDEEAQYAFRELQSAGNISSSTTYKDKYGNLVSMVKTVKSHFASMLATTKAEVYYDNMSRSVIIGVDESDPQTKRIIEYQNKKLAGLIDQRTEENNKKFLQNCMRCIKTYEVVNRYADKIHLPAEAKMLRRLNSHYQAFVKQITILHQYQRQKDEQGRLIAEPQDLQMACDILFDAIILKVDDLDSSLRQFFDRMKEYVRSKFPSSGAGREGIFTQRDVRLALSLSKASCFRYMEDLELLEYVQKVGGYANRGFKYKIVFWDDLEKIRSRIKDELNRQLGQLKNAA